MAPTKCFAYVTASDRTCSGRVQHLACNPRLDLVALVVGSKQVLLQRHFWKKAWQTVCADEVTAIVWHPSGQCLCVAMTNGLLQLLHTETGVPIHQLQLVDAAVSCLHWTACANATLPKVVFICSLLLCIML